MRSIAVQCGDCKGTGVTRDRRDPKGLGLMCSECQGSGKKDFYYKPFTKRRVRNGITEVTKLSAGLGAMGFCASAGPRIPYSEFLKGKIPLDAIQIMNK